MVRLLICVATWVNSETPTINARDVSLIIETNWFTKEGIILRSPWGSTIYIITCHGWSPVESPASVCPAGMLSIPAFTICDMYADVKMVRAMITVQFSGTVRPIIAGNRKYIQKMTIRRGIPLMMLTIASDTYLTTRL